MTSFKPEGTAAALMDDFVNGILRRVDRHIAEGLPPLGSTVASYERISDDREGKELGVARQREDTTELAAQDGHTIPEQAKFQDNDLGASTRSRKPRPDFERLMAYVISGQVKVVYAYSNSRLTRRPMELELLIRVADRAGVQYRTKASGSDDLATADGRMVARIKAAVDAAEAERTGERVARTHLQSAQAGKVFRDRRLGQPDVSRQVNDPVLTERQVLQDCQPGWVAETVEEARGSN